MATLADLNEKLAKQNEHEVEQTKSIDNMSAALTSLVETFKRNELDELEEKIESRKTAAESSAKAQASKPESKGLFEDFSLAGLTGFAAGMVAALPGFLLKRALPALLAKMFADQIANYVESATGSKSLGDAIFRGLNLGALGLLVSKRLGAIGFIAGALLDEANRQKLDELGNTLTEFGDNIAKFFGFDGLPNFEKALQFITTTLGNAIDFLNATLKGDFDSEEFKTGMDDFALAIGGLALMFKRVRKLIGSMVMSIGSAVKTGAKVLTGVGLGAATAAADTAAVAAPAAMNREQMVKEAGKMSNKQLAKLGMEKTAAGGIVQKGTNKAVSNEALKGALDMKASAKFPKMAKFLKFGPIAALLAGYDIYSILSQPGSVDDKVAALGGVLGAVLGAGGGASLGAAMGSIFPGPGTLIGGVLGGGIGYFAGDAVGKGLAQYLLGQKVDAMPFDTLNDMLNTPSTNGSINGETSSTNESMSERADQLKPQAFAAFRPATGENLQALSEEQATMNNAPASTNIVDASDKSVSVINNSGMTVTGPIGTPFDTYNKYVLYA